MTADLSFAQQTAAELVGCIGIDAALDEMENLFDELPVVDLAAHEYDWRETWARPKQLPPLSDWKSWGFLSGRGFGKTYAISQWVNEEVDAGRARSICLIAQDEDNAVKLLVTGPSGLIATALPWNRPVWHVSELTLMWPNGAIAYVRTPEVPDKIRGFDYDLAWWAERQSWPKTTRDEALMNLKIATRIGLARTVWDATAKRGHPHLKAALERTKRNPTRHVVVRGSTYENADYLAKGYIEEIESEIGGTQQGDEELHGNMDADATKATAKQEWIDRNRAIMPRRFLRRVLSADPAVTSRAGSDSTGIVEGGLSDDGRALILGDHTGKMAPEEWASKLLDRYVDGRCDLIVVETNKGGDLLVRNLRACASERKLSVAVIGKKDRAPGHQDGIVHVREIYSRGEKADRARPLSTAIQKNRVGFVGEFFELEGVLTTWEPSPGARSPDRLDATVAAVVELLGLDVDTPDPKKAFVGLIEANRALSPPTRGPRRTVSSLFSGGNSGGGRI